MSTVTQICFYLYLMSVIFEFFGSKGSAHRFGVLVCALMLRDILEKING